MTNRQTAAILTALGLATALVALAMAVSCCIASVAAGADARPVLVEDECDVLELNHLREFDNPDREIVFQAIFYDWNPGLSRYVVRFWRLIKSPGQLPILDHRGWLVVWHDGDTLRRVRARIVRETWTGHDPEIDNRRHLPKEQRAGLFGEQPAQVWLPAMDGFPERWRRAIREALETGIPVEFGP